MAERPTVVAERRKVAKSRRLRRRRMWRKNGKW
jgi:hypothetical protein